MLADQATLVLPAIFFAVQKGLGRGMGGGMGAMKSLTCVGHGKDSFSFVLQHKVFIC